MGLTFRQVSYWENTITLFNRNLEVAGDNELAHFNLGSTYLENNKLDMAVIHLSAAAQMNPNDATTYNNLGIIYARQKKDSLAEAYFSRAILLNPKSVQPYFNLAALKTKQRLFGEALEYINKVIQLTPDNQEARAMQKKLTEAMRHHQDKTHE